MTRLCVRFAIITLAASAACVGTSKSSNPLSPTIAGPIPGVGISAPTVVAPAVDAMVNTNTQPITLQVGNAETSGVRPLSYRFEIAFDPNFTNAVYTKEGIPQDASGRTAHTLPGPLSPERKYYWHARAEDGANTGPFGATSAFSVFTPIVFGAPTLLYPVKDETANSNQPRLLIGNASHSGPVDRVFYRIELATTAAFNPLIGEYTVPETSNQTELAIPVSLSSGQYFWRAQATDLSNTGVFSAAQSFRAPASSGGGGGGGSFTPGGDWQSCGSTPGPEIVGCVNAAVNPPRTVDGAFEVVKRVAWLLRGSGGKLLIKNGGENVSIWNGMSFSASRVCYPGPGGAGQIYKILSDVPTTNGPGWSDNGTVDPSLCVAAMQP
jgi:hypothetical protein